MLREKEKNTRRARMQIKLYHPSCDLEDEHVEGPYVRGLVEAVVKALGRLVRVRAALVAARRRDPAHLQLGRAQVRQLGRQLAVHDHQQNVGRFDVPMLHLTFWGDGSQKKKALTVGVERKANLNNKY